MDKERLSLIRRATRRQRKIMSQVGQPVENSPGETVRLWIDYPESRCVRDGDFWNIPEYSNGTTRPARCVFRLESLHTGSGGYEYIGDWEELSRKLSASDRERVLADSVIDGTRYEIVWSYDMARPAARGQYFYHIKRFWFAVRVEGRTLLTKHSHLKDLSIPPERVECAYCKVHKPVSKMDFVQRGPHFGEWACHLPNPSLYSKCPE